MTSILWTGGYDSTAMVLREILNGGEFETISFRITNNERQCASEQRARDDIRDILSPVAGRWREARVHDFPLIEGPQMACPQAAMWVTWPLWFAKGDEIAVGWVRGDDAWHYRHELVGAFEALARVIRGDGVKLSFPFEWSTKSDLLSYYEDVGSKLGVDPLLLLSRISTTETGTCWASCRSDKGKVMRQLWDEARLRGRSVADLTDLTAAVSDMVDMPVEEVKEAKRHDQAR